jgi:hypothetical protein
MAGLKIGPLAFIDNCVRFDDGAIPVFADSLTTWDGTTLTFAGEEYQVRDEMTIGGGMSAFEAGVSRVKESGSAGDMRSAPAPERRRHLERRHLFALTRSAGRCARAERTPS